MTPVVNACFVLASHRRRGAGRLIMEWGTKLADKLNLESFVESTDDGCALYKAHGFVVVDHILLDPEVKRPSEEWKRLKKEVAPRPFPIVFMWRPKGGKFEDGKTVYSWENDRVGRGFMFRGRRWWRGLTLGKLFTCNTL